MVFGYGGGSFGGSFGNQPPIPPATTAHQGLMSAADKTLVNQLRTGTGWTTVAVFGANWSGYGAGNAVPAYKKDALGWVCLEGMFKKSAALIGADPLFTLPFGSRPATDHHFPVVASGTTLGWVKVATTGIVSLEGGGSATWVSLAGVRFDPAT